MFFMYSIRKTQTISGVSFCLKLYVDCDYRGYDLSLFINGRTAPFPSRYRPYWSEIDTPEKAEAWVDSFDFEAIEKTEM